MSLTFTRTRDTALIRELVTAPGSWDAATDDSAPAAADFQPHDDARVWYVIASDPGGLIGLYTFIPQSAVCFEMHITRAFGSRAIAATRAIAPWMFARSGARRLVASVPATNRVVIRHARSSGFTQFGRNPRSFLKRGRLVDQILFGISPEDTKD